MKRALLMSINSKQWEDLKKSAREKKAEEDVECVETWRGMFIFIRSVFPAIKALRLADSNRPGMDKIYFFVHKTSLALDKSAPDLDDRLLFPKVSTVAAEEDDEDDFPESDEGSKDDEAEAGDEDSVDTEATDTDEEDDTEELSQQEDYRVLGQAQEDHQQ